MRLGGIPPDGPQQCGAQPGQENQPFHGDDSTPHTLKRKLITSPSCDHVVLAFEAELAGFAHLRFGLQGQEVLDAHHLGADEAALDVRVDLAGRLVGREALADRPGTALVFARGEEADERQQREGRADEPVARRLGEAERRDEVLLLGGRHLGDVLLDLGRQDDQAEAALAACSAIAAGGGSATLGLVHVQDEEQRLLRQEAVAGEERPVVLRERQVAKRTSGLEMGLQLRQQTRPRAACPSPSSGARAASRRARGPRGSSRPRGRRPRAAARRERPAAGSTKGPRHLAERFHLAHRREHGCDRARGPSRRRRPRPRRR